MPKKIYTDESARTICRKFVKLSSQGKSITSVAAELGVSRDILYRWAKDPKKPEFKEAWGLGKTLCEAYHEQLLDDIITGKVKGNVVGQMYRMKCMFRERWLENQKQQIEVTNTSQMSEKELDETINTYLKNIVKQP